MSHVRVLGRACVSDLHGHMTRAAVAHLVEERGSCDLQVGMVSKLLDPANLQWMRGAVVRRLGHT